MARSPVVEGAFRALTLAPGIIPIGILFGAAAAAVGLSPAAATALSAFVFAGGAQFAALGLLAAGAALAPIVALVAIVNSRYFLLSAATLDLARRAGASRFQRVLLALGVVDESYALQAAWAKERAQKAAAGAALGEAALGEAALGEAALGEAALGDGMAGGGARGDSALGESALGESAPGGAARGEAARRFVPRGESARGRGSAGDAPRTEHGRAEGARAAAGSAGPTGAPVPVAGLLAVPLVFWAMWVGSTLVGALIGERVPDLEPFGLDYALPGIFVGLLGIFADTRPRLLAGLAALAVAGGLALAGYGTVAVLVVPPLMAFALGRWAPRAG